MPNYDFLLELRLKELNSDFAHRYASGMLLFEQMLKKFLAVFPSFTDHTLLHTLNVTNISNQLIRENIVRLNGSEIYIYLMSCALHDIGMGVSDRDIDFFIDASGVREYVDEHSDIPKPNLIRMFHNDFSAQFVKKYWDILEIPNKRYADAIAEVARGHRKTDLMDEKLYPTDYELGDGNKANIALLAALLRVCDDLDIASDRNPDLLYNSDTMEQLEEKDMFEFAKHNAIHTVNFDKDSIVVLARTDKPHIFDGIKKTLHTVKETFEYCIFVISKRSDFDIDCKEITLILNDKITEV